MFWTTWRYKNTALATWESIVSHSLRGEPEMVRIPYFYDFVYSFASTSGSDFDSIAVDSLTYVPMPWEDDIILIYYIYTQ